MFPVTTTSAGSFAASRRICGISTRPWPSSAPVLTVVVDPLEKLALGAVNRRKRGELLFERRQIDERIDEDLAAVERGHEELRPEGLFDLLSKEVRHLQPALLVETGRRAALESDPSFFSCPDTRDQDHFPPLFSRLDHCAGC